MSSSKKITLKCSDGVAFEVEEAVALQSQTIKHMIRDNCADNGIPISKISSRILAKVIEYCKKHVEALNTEDDLENWDKEFVKVDRDTLLDLILAADDLKIQSLLDLTCRAVSDKIKWMNAEEIRNYFTSDIVRSKL